MFNSIIRYCWNYGVMFNSGFQLMLAAGYQVDHYFHILNRASFDAGSIIAMNPPGVTTFTLVAPVIRKTSDISLQGPYVSLTAII